MNIKKCIPVFIAVLIVVFVLAYIFIPKTGTSQRETPNTYSLDDRIAKAAEIEAQEELLHESNIYESESYAVDKYYENAEKAGISNARTWLILSDKATGKRILLQDEVLSTPDKIFEKDGYIYVIGSDHQSSAISGLNIMRYKLTSDAIEAVQTINLDDNIKFKISSSYYAKPELIKDPYSQEISSVYFNVYSYKDDTFMERVGTSFQSVDPDRDISAKIFFVAEDETYSDRDIEFKISSDNTYDLSS